MSGVTIGGQSEQGLREKVMLVLFLRCWWCFDDNDADGVGDNRGSNENDDGVDDGSDAEENWGEADSDKGDSFHSHWAGVLLARNHACLDVWILSIDKLCLFPAFRELPSERNLTQISTLALNC